MSFFRRKPATHAPADVTERWSEQDTSVHLHIPFNGADREPAKTADELTQRIIATVNAVQAGEFGQSIPDGVQGATVTLVVDCGDTAITPLATQAIEVLRERLGKSMPIMVQSNPDAARTGAHGDTSTAVSLPTVPRTGPDGKKLGLWDSLKAAAEEQARAQSAAAGSPRAPRDTLTLPTYTWNDNTTELQADIIVLGDAGDDEQTRTDVSYLVEQSLAALATPEVTSLVPAGTEGYGIRLTVTVNDDAAGDRTRQKLDEGKNQFANTRVIFDVTIASREDVKALLPPA